MNILQREREEQRAFEERMEARERESAERDRRWRKEDRRANRDLFIVTAIVAFLCGILAVYIGSKIWG